MQKQKTDANSGENFADKRTKEQASINNQSFFKKLKSII